MIGYCCYRYYWKIVTLENYIKILGWHNAQCSKTNQEQKVKELGGIFIGIKFIAAENFGWNSCNKKVKALFRYSYLEISLLWLGWWFKMNTDKNFTKNCFFINFQNQKFSHVKSFCLLSISLWSCLFWKL